MAARLPPKAIESLSACSSGNVAPDEWNAIQIALWIGMNEIQRRRRKTVAQSKRRDCQFHAARSIHQVTKHRFLPN